MRFSTQRNKAKTPQEPTEEVKSTKEKVVAMFSSCRSSSKGRKAKCVNPYEKLGTSTNETVRRKLETMEQYQPLAPLDMREKIRDLTELKRLRDWFDDDEGRHTDKVSVWLCISSRSRSSTVGVPPGEGEDRGRALSLRRKFEQFCEWGVNSDVSLRVNRTILKWNETSIIEPHLESLPGNDYNPAGAVCSRPETREKYLGESSKLNELLNVITTYNERRSFDQSNRNSKHFIRDALKALGIPCPQVLSVYEDYVERIKVLRSPNIPEKFDSPIALCHYTKHNFRRVQRNVHDIEYLYFMCIVSHMSSPARETSVSSAQECAELNSCLHDLDGAVREVQGDLIFHEFWIQFRL